MLAERLHDPVLCATLLVSYHISVKFDQNVPVATVSGS